MYELTSEQEKLVETTVRKFKAAEKVHKLYRPRWEHYFSLYRLYRDWDSYMYGSSSPPDRDTGLGDARSQFGADLFIPVCFSTVEQVLPRLLAQAPRMLILPRDKDAETNADNMKFLIDGQMARINFELKLQDVAKDGLIFGLGVLKTFWHKEVAMRRYLKPATQPTPTVQYVQGMEERVIFDDPDAEAVDIFDFFWDPQAYDIPSSKCLFHRTWRDHDYVMDKIKSGQWRETELTEDDVRMLGPGEERDYESVWRARMRVAGFDRPTDRGQQPHEVWEYHDGAEVVTVLDRKVPVQKADNPAWHGEMPFQIYRPTRVNKHFVGIGEIEPLEHLQEELNTMRTQRRDAASLAIQRPFAYTEGAIDEADLKFGIGTAMPVQGFDPREVLFPIPIPDLPASSYQEENALLADITRTSGLSDPSSEGGETATATGAQLVHARETERIKNKTRLLEVETIRAAARQWLALNQQKILTERPITIPGQAEPGEPERRWTWRMVGPGGLQGEMEIEPEGGSTAPDNVPQMRQDAQFMAQLAGGNPNIDQRRAWSYILKNLGVENPDAWLSPVVGGVPPEALDIILKGLINVGANPVMAKQMIDQAVTQARLDQQEQAQQAGHQPPEPDGQAQEQGATSNGNQPAGAAA